ncbi:MAG: methionyl-tRNA formyltransferase, partial [Chloroflexi bacterium]|nr:methionyl-tRNA formyltransferase [Chloroflexota bacterium]
ERAEIAPRPQDESRATVTRLLEREDGEIHWDRPAEQLERTVRAYDPWPGTFTSWEGRNIKVLEAVVGGAGPDDLPAGAVISANHAAAIVTGRGLLMPKRLQLEGRRSATVEEFVRGYPRFIGARLPS